MIKNVLRRVLRDKGISITELTNKVGLSRTAIYNFMNKDTKTYRIKTMEAICEYLHMNISQIIYYEAPTQRPLIDPQKNTMWDCKYSKTTVFLNQYSSHPDDYSYHKFHTNICSHKINFVINNTNIRMILIAKMLIYRHNIFIGYESEGEQPNFISYFSNPHNLQQIAYRIIKDNNQYLKSFNKVNNDLKTYFPKLLDYLNKHHEILNKIGINDAKFRYINTTRDQLTVKKNNHYRVFVVPLSFIYGGYLSGLESDLGETNSFYKDGNQNGYKNISISFDLYKHNLSNLHQDKITRTVYNTYNPKKDPRIKNIFELSPSAFKELK